MAIFTEEFTLETTIPIDIGIFKPYLFVYTPMGSDQWDRVFNLYTGKVCNAIVYQPVRPSTEMSVRVHSEEALNEKEIKEIRERLKFELGLEENLRPLKVIAAKDPVFKKALFSVPGFRLFANSNFDEAFMQILFSKYFPVPKNYILMKKFMETYGNRLSWNSKRFSFPSRETLLAISIDDWRKFGVKGNVTHFYNSVQAIEDAEIFTYYPVPERGFKKLRYMPGIKEFMARALMTYCARIYTYPIYDIFITEVLHDLYSLPDEINLDTYTYFMERFKPIPALVIQVLATYHAPVFLKKLHEDFDVYK